MLQTFEFWSVLGGSAIVYWLLPARVRSWFLLAVSFIFMDWVVRSGEATGFSRSIIWVLTAWSVVFFYALRWAKTRSWIAPWLLVVIIGQLLYFKYIPPLMEAIFTSLNASILIPLGISFFSFKLIHYTIEARRGNLDEHGLVDFLNYILLFPIYTAGPIERFDHFLAERETRFNYRTTVDGLTRIAHGLVKKFVLAEMFVHQMLMNGREPSELLQALNAWPTWQVWAYLILFYGWVYLDFSAYSDLAIGCSRLFGIKIMENFNWPWLAPNMTEFWQRWHMTLSGWCRAYVYMPMIGLTRKPFLAIFATFMVMGLWHAGNLHWVGWGLYQAGGVSVYVLWSQIKRKKKWKHLDKGWRRLPGIALTNLYFAGSMALTAMDGTGTIMDSLRIFAKMLFL